MPGEGGTLKVIFIWKICNALLNQIDQLDAAYLLTHIFSPFSSWALWAQVIGVFIHFLHVHENYDTWVGDRRRVNCAFVNYWLDLTEEMRGVVKTVAED